MGHVPITLTDEAGEHPKEHEARSW